jgi:hypothetical protein
MKIRLRNLFGALALGLAFLPAISLADSMSPERRVARLDSLVSLSGAQKAQATEIFALEVATLDSIGGSPQDRALKGMPAREQSRAQIRALLTPAQRKKYDISPQTAGGGLMVNPEFIVARIDKLLSLNSDQKRQATAIIWNELIEQVAATPEDQTLKGFHWQQATVDQVRGLLTAEQQRIYDSTPLSQGGGQLGPGLKH